MAKKRGVRVSIVVEDRALERFSREILLRFGFGRDELRVTPYPVGRGSAKQWVEEQYPLEVRAMRSKRYQNLAVVVGTDADEATVNQRRSRLARALQSHNLAARAEGERIVFWIPKWNVETWILYFAGDRRDEDHDYRNDVKEPDYRATAEAFVRQYREYKQGGAIDTQPSLLPAYEETARLDV